MAKKAVPSKVTIVEVAEKAGVSLGTVSRVMNNDSHVAPETRERVSAVMREMGMLPIVRRRVKRRRTNVIGVLAPDLAGATLGKSCMASMRNSLHHFDLMFFTHRTAIKEANYVANMVQVWSMAVVVLPRNPLTYRHSHKS
jgi:LacI family transcriptional regulator